MASKFSILKNIPHSKEDLYRLLVFVLTIVVITYLFPREKKFKYEFQKGKPWSHEVLIAPFDFPIYKSELEIKAEKDSLVRYFKHYFSFNDKIKLRQKALFTTAFNKEWQELEHKNSQKNKAIDKAETLLLVQSILDFIYDKGIIENVETEKFSTENKEQEVMVIRERIAEPFEFNSFFTTRTAYEYYQRQIAKLSVDITERTHYDISSLFNKIRIETLLIPNIRYDINTSQKYMNQELQQISETKGMVQAGERIIFTGDVVNEKSYKKLESLRTEYETRIGDSTERFGLILGQALIVTILLTLLFFYLHFFKRDVFENRLRISFIFFILSLFAVVTSIVLSYSTMAMLIVPLAMFPVLIRTFYDVRIANFSYFILILILGFWAPNSFEFIFINFIAGVTANLSMSKNYRRGKLFITAVLVFLAYSLSYSAYTIITEGSIRDIQMAVISNFAVNSLLMLSAIPVIYVLEKLFGFVSDATLLELSDTNQPLLRRMAEEAPGTFQHSLQVANLAEEAAFSISANALLVRAGALYHDIGKIIRPILFTENQTEGLNPHNQMEFEESARAIIGHVNLGVELALKNKLPKQIIDFIRTHHGVTTAKYFYRSFQKKYPDALIDRDAFSYPGPQPFSKEMALLMMADSVEAASRSLKSFDEMSISVLVDAIINEQMQSGQFNDANITFSEITTVKSVFKRRLVTIYHKRIEYPKAINNEQD